MDKEFYGALLKPRQVPLFGSIDEESSERVSASVLFLNAINRDEEIKLLINSIGGSVLPGLEMYDCIRLSHAPITGIVIGCAHSMAAVVLQACDKRIATAHAEVLVHPTSGNGIKMILASPTKEYPYGAPDWESVQNEIQISGGTDRMAKIIKILCDRTGRSADEIVKLVNKNKAISAQEALDNGLIDEIAQEFKI